MATDDRIVLITGTSTGIGLEAAVAAARAGWRVVATMRDTTRAGRLTEAAEAAGVVVHVHQLDVTDQGSIDAAVQAVVGEHGRLDALVNNAGAPYVATVETGDPADFRACLEVNFFGVVQTTRAALPHLRASGGRVVTVSSVGGVVGQPFNEAYCAAKFAVEGFLEALAPVAAAVGVGVTVIEPGAVASEFVANAGVDAEAMIAAAGPYAAPLKGYLDRTTAQFGASAQSAAAAGAVVAGALDLDPLPFRIQTSDAARAFAGVKLADLDGSAVQRLTTGWLGQGPTLAS